MKFVDAWRRQKCRAFDLERNSTAREIVEFELWGQPVRIYANANLSVYSAQTCNAHCRFCVEELRPLSRGGELTAQKQVERDDARYFSRLNEALCALRPLNPSVSVTGGEASKDPRLPEILSTLAAHNGRKRTLTTNGSGLLDTRGRRQLIDCITESGVKYLNISRAHPEQERNAELMILRDGLSVAQLHEVVSRARAGGTRVRLSCVLLRGEIDSLEGILRYLDFAASIGVDNVIFRQLMMTDARTVQRNSVVQYSDSHRVQLESLLDQISVDARFSFQRQIVGYYYYVEVWRHANIDVVFEEADLAQLENTKRSDPGVIHELIFHPNGELASTWQPWDGLLKKAAVTPIQSA
jgi:GTP 3',8-cyclase